MKQKIKLKKKIKSRLVLLKMKLNSKKKIKSRGACPGNE